MGADEKRAHERLVASYPVRIRAGGGKSLAGTVENFGALGALVSTLELEPPIEVGETMTITITMPGMDSIDASGEVLRVDQEFAAGEIRRSFALKFDEPLDV